MNKTYKLQTKYCAICQCEQLRLFKNGEQIEFKSDWTIDEHVKAIIKKYKLTHANCWFVKAKTNYW